MNLIKIACTITFVTFLSLALFGKSHKMRVQKRAHTFFYASQFAGTLKDVYAINGGVGLKLNGGSRYVFYPSKDMANETVKELGKISLTKNKIYKNENSDTFFVIANNHTRYYVSRPI